MGLLFQGLQRVLLALRTVEDFRGSGLWIHLEDVAAVLKRLYYLSLCFGSEYNTGPFIDFAPSLNI